MFDDVTCIASHTEAGLAQDFFLILSTSTCMCVLMGVGGGGVWGLMRLGKYFNRLLEKVCLLFVE